MASSISDFLPSNIDLRDARTAALATVSTIAALSAAWVLIDYSKFGPRRQEVIQSLVWNSHSHPLMLGQVNGSHLARAVLRRHHQGTGE